MDPNRKPDRIISEWDAIVGRAQRPARAPRPRRSLAGLGAAFGLAGAGVLAAALIVAVLALGGRISSSVGSSPSAPTASQVAVASVPPTPTPSPVAASPAVTPSPAPTRKPVESTPPPATPVCAPDVLTARITAWEGAAGSRIADISVTNHGSVGCELPEPKTLALIDGANKTLMSGVGPAGSAIHLAAGETVTTLVDASNYCGATPSAPVTVRFDVAGHDLKADPVSPTDATVPPCNGATVAASIQMQPWSH
jgi:Protein of unknown function (DUF4232)